MYSRSARPLNEQRTYSDYHFFGRLQAARKSILVKEVTGLGGTEGAEAFVRQLSPESFDVWMRKEVAELERCFVAYPDGRLVWMPPPVKSRLSWDCEVALGLPQPATNRLSGTPPYL